MLNRVARDRVNHHQRNPTETDVSPTRVSNYPKSVHGWRACVGYLAEGVGASNRIYQMSQEVYRCVKRRIEIDTLSPPVTYGALWQVTSPSCSRTIPRESHMLEQRPGDNA